MTKFLRQSGVRPLEKSDYMALFNVCSFSESVSTSSVGGAAASADYHNDDYVDDDETNLPIFLLFLMMKTDRIQH